MAFAQLTHRENLRDIEVCLRAQKNKLYHRGIRGNVSRSAVADAKERRDWRNQRKIVKNIPATEPHGLVIMPPPLIVPRTRG